jgi:uncharacterized protein (DUF952 family)
VTQRHLTLHIVPEPYWRASDPAQPYRPEPFEREGFIHCTDGAERMAEVANRYYRDDPREYLVLVIDLARLTSPWRYDDAEHLFPHIYGPLNRDAIIATHPMPRANDGSFLPPAL